jgi:hypothetical protein
MLRFDTNQRYRPIIRDEIRQEALSHVVCYKVRADRRHAQQPDIPRRQECTQASVLVRRGVPGNLQKSGPLMVANHGDVHAHNPGDLLHQLSGFNTAQRFRTRRTWPRWGTAGGTVPDSCWQAIDQVLPERGQGLV